MSQRELPPDNPFIRTYRGLYMILFGPLLTNKGLWNASTNSPNLQNGVGGIGDWYTVSDPGTTNLDGNASWNLGDIAAFDGEVWLRNPTENELYNWVKPANRIDFSKNNDNPIKETVVDADTPEVQLRYEGSNNFNPHANSSGMSYTMNIGIYCQTDDLRLQLLTSLDWYIACNLTAWRDKLAKCVKWRGDFPVKNLSSMPVAVGLTNPETTRRVVGWASIWRFQVELRIDNENIVHLES